VPYREHEDQLLKSRGERTIKRKGIHCLNFQSGLREECMIEI